MDKREYLSRAMKLESQIKASELMAEEYHQLYEVMSTLHNDNTGEYEDALKWSKKAKAEEEHLSELKQLLQTLKIEIVNTIDKIQNLDLRLVLMYHYVEGLSWARIQKKMFLSKSTVLRLHKRALDALKI